MINEPSDKTPYQVAIGRQESVLFDEFDNDADE